MTFDNAKAASALRRDGLDLAEGTSARDLGGGRWEVEVVGRMSVVTDPTVADGGTRVLAVNGKGAWSVEKGATKAQAAEDERIFGCGRGGLL